MRTGSSYVYHSILVLTSYIQNRQNRRGFNAVQWQLSFTDIWPGVRLFEIRNLYCSTLHCHSSCFPGSACAFPRDRGLTGCRAMQRQIFSVKFLNVTRWFCDECWRWPHNQCSNGWYLPKRVLCSAFIGPWIILLCSAQCKGSVTEYSSVSRKSTSQLSPWHSWLWKTRHGTMR